MAKATPCRIAVFLLMTQFLVCSAFAEEPLIENEDYDASDSVKKAKGVILEQKRQLEAGGESEEELKQKQDEEEEEARREIYEQRIVQEVEYPQRGMAIERRLQRERIRRDVMVRAGKEIKPPLKTRTGFSLKTSETYDDNIYLTKTNAKEDHITKISPSVLFSMTSKVVALDLNYVMDITRYQNRKDQSGTSHLLMTYIRPGSLALPFFHRRGGKIGLEIQDDFQPLITSVATSEQTERSDRTQNEFSAAVDYYMSPKRTLSLEYKNKYQYYRTSTLRTYSTIENDISPTFYFHVSPKWSVLAGYEYGVIDYMEGGDDSSRHQSLKGGVIGKVLKKVLTRIEAGKEWRVYKDEANGKANKVFFTTAFTNRFSPSTMASLELNYTISESTYTGNPYYMESEIDFDIEHKITYKTTGTFGLACARHNYDRYTTEDGATKKRMDNLFQPSVGIRYYFKRWLVGSLSYDYRKRTSNFGKFGYVNNRIIGAIDIQF